ncbi:MAG: hypothetical protein N2050_10700 [Flavobacteriales bacterium]|nr:hypothetical protein [Flavobacteriales bacterium]MCX7651000.1 hypothetical protein [Flavobacteriales bacterium]MDW8432418.1 hypothetical protein [Flavobacteriales bacterium]
MDGSMLQLVQELKDKVEKLMQEHSRLKQENEFLWKENTELKNTVLRLSEVVQTAESTPAEMGSLSSEEIRTLAQQIQQVLEGMKADIEYCLGKLNEQTPVHA